MTNFDPDVLDTVAYDDRPERVVKTPDPIRQTRNRRNKERGRRAERNWTGLINDALKDAGYNGEVNGYFGWAEGRGGLGGADVTWLTYAFEVKQCRGAWPSNTIIKNAIVQAKANAGNRTPVVIACKTSHKLTEWRFYNAVGMYMDATDWLAERIKELAP